MTLFPNLELNKKLPLKVAVYFVGMFIGCGGTAVITLNALGSDAMNTLFTAVAVKLQVLPGIVYTVFNSTMLVVGFLVARRYMGVGSFLMILVQGFFINMWLHFFSAFAPWLFVGWAKAPTAALGVLLTSFGSALSTSMQLGTAGFEACLFTLADKIKIEYKYLKTASELVYFALAFLLDGVFGIMTLIQPSGAFISSFFMENLNKTLWVRLGIDDERNRLSRNRREKADPAQPAEEESHACTP